MNSVSIIKNFCRVNNNFRSETIRLTRCSFSSAPSKNEEQVEVNQKNKEHPPNSSIIPGVVNNRNPRNLEKIRIAEKADGWDLEKPGKSFWNKISLEISGKHITAKVMHVYGQVPVFASTTEWCIKKYLYSTKDATAAKAIGQILAHRCLQAGITEVACFFTEEERKKDKVGTFLKALEEGGVSLEEPDQFQIPWALNYPTYPEKPWEVHEDIDDKMEQSSKILSIMKKVQTKTKDKA